MTGKLESVVLHSIRTFRSSGQSGSNIVGGTNFRKLVNLTNEVRFTDLKIPSRLLNKKEETLHSRDPVAHFSVYEDSDVSIGVFILKHGAKIPLHDHPGMHGLIRVLHGTIKISSYTILEVPSDNVPSASMFYSKPLTTVRNSPVVTSSNEGCSVLEPMRNNIHEITCVAGPAAFLDILSPPYCDDINESLERSCHYFRETEINSNNVVKLTQIPCPGDYWSEQELSV